MNVLFKIKEKFPELTLEIFFSFLNTHYIDLILNDEIDIYDEFFEWAYFNNVINERFGS
jgi:hypothetical protein